MRRDRGRGPLDRGHPPPVRAGHDVGDACPAASPPAAAAPAQADQGRPPEATNNLDRIRKALSQEPAIKMEDYRLKFYVEIIARWPTFQDYIGKDADLMNGPVRGSGMTHADFLGIVTPNMYGTSGGIRPVEALQFSIVNWLGQSLARKAIESFRNGRDESDLRRIRQRIEEELASLRGKGGEEKSRVKWEVRSQE